MALCQEIERDLENHTTKLDKEPFKTKKTEHTIDCSMCVPSFYFQ